MLLFTNAQEQGVIAGREQFNASQVAMASRVTITGNAAPIPVDAWRRLDAEAAQIQRDELVVFNTLAAASNQPVGLGDLVSFYPQISDSGSVNVSMDGRGKGKADQANVKFAGTPVPIVDDEVRIGWRQMEVIRKGGGMIDQESISNSQRKVAEKLEDMAINGLSSIVVNGSTIYGLRTFPQRNTDTHGFDLSAATGANWLATFVKLVNALVGDNAYGRITVFMNYADWTYASLNEFTAGYPKTILQRLKEIEQIERIVPSTRIPADEVIGIASLSSRKWGKILNGMPLMTRPNQRLNPEDDYSFTVLAAAAPQFRADYDGRSQIAHLTAA